MRARVLLGFALAAASAVAQEPDAPAPVAPAPDAPAPDAPLDPLLAPVPPAARSIASWEEARGLLAERSTELRSAVLEVDRAEGRWRQSLAALLPTGRAQGGIGYDILNPKVPALGIVGAGAASAALAQGVPATTPVGGAAVTINVPVIDVASWSGLSSWSAGVEAAELSEDDARRRVTQGLSRSLVAVVAAERAAELNREGLRQSLERAALVDKQLALGASARLDVVRIQQDVELARASVVAGDEQLHRAREALGQLLGDGAEMGVAPTFALTGLVDDVAATCRRVEDGARDDVRAAAARTTQAQRLREQALWGYLPRLDLATSAAALTTPTTIVHPATWSIGAVISIPIWEGGLREGLLAERDAAARITAEQEDATARAVAVDVARAVRNEGTARALTASARAGRELAAEADALTQKAFALGRVGTLDVVQAAQALRLAELTLALREFEWAQARVDALLSLSRCSP